jgi:hypothetical protein
VDPDRARAPARRPRCPSRLTDVDTARNRRASAPVALIIALTLLTAYAVKLAILGGDEFLRDADIRSYPRIKRLADIIGLYVIALLAINFVSVVLQCGLGECHTFGYRLLGG